MLHRESRDFVVLHLNSKYSHGHTIKEGVNSTWQTSVESTWQKYLYWFLKAEGVHC